MEKREWWCIGILFTAVLLLALVKDLSSGEELSNGKIRREGLGGDKKTVNLILDAEGVLEGYTYEIEIEPEKVTKEQADIYFSNAIQEIDKDFEDLDGEVPMKEIYVEGLVEAEWIFQPHIYISADGTVLQGMVPEEGVVINGEARLFCGEYEMVYQFPFVLQKPELPLKETILSELSDYIDSQMQKEGSAEIQLPEEVAGIKLSWEEKKDPLFVKVFFLEVFAVIGILIGKQKTKEKEERIRKQCLEEDYPDLVNQLTVLLGAGMTMRQAWSRIVTQYQEKRALKMMESREVYEEIIYMHRQITEGEKERIVYQKFADRLESLSYRRLMRLLLNNLEKGSKDLSRLLEEECRNAYGQRIILAKTKGEEASTKMLLPLMLMMMLVMAIVLLPAIINFTI